LALLRVATSRDDGGVSDEASPFGRYLIPPVERVMNVVLAAGLGYFARWQLDTQHAAQDLPGWYRVFLPAALTGLFSITVLAWLLPATFISPKGIRRVYAGKRRLDWDEVSDFTVRRRWGARRIYVKLLNGRRYSLDGVPLRALEPLRRYIGTGDAKTGSWWLVDYSEASSTSSS
jgi:hypothetical protein